MGDWNVTNITDRCMDRHTGMSCLLADLVNPLVNPHLHPVTEEHFWLTISLDVVASIGLLLNLFILLRLPCYFYDGELNLLRLLNLVDLLLLIELLIHHLPPVLPLSSTFLMDIFPHLLLYLPSLEAGLVTFSSFLLLILVGGRHLKQLESRTYSCNNPVLFSLFLSLAVGIPVMFETIMTSLSKDQILEMNMDHIHRMNISNEDPLSGLNISSMDPIFGTNMSRLNQLSWMNISNLNLDENNLVIHHTPLYHDKTYSDMFRMLFNFLTSQVVNIWFLPIIFLHSCNVFNLDKRRGRPRDYLTPLLALTTIFLSIPKLAVLINQVLLNPPSVRLGRITILSLASLSTTRPFLYLVFDTSIRRWIFKCNGRGRYESAI